MTDEKAHNETRFQDDGAVETTADDSAVVIVAADGTAQVSQDPAAVADDEKRAAADAAASSKADAPSKPIPDKPAVVVAAITTGSPMSEPKTVSSSSVPSEPVAPVIIKNSSGKGVALGALVLSLLALGASGFLFVQGQNLLKTQELSFDQKISEAGLGQSKNAALLAGNVTKLQSLVQDVQALQAQGKQADLQLAASNRAYQELVKSRADWVVDETEATLNLAAQQLLISGNVPVAVGVLEGLESRLVRFDQPQLLPIKQAISQDLSALKTKPYLDVTSASLRLNRLETAVASLPLAADNTLQAAPETAPAAAVDANAAWWQRAWQSTVHSLKGMVEVRRISNNDSMLLSPEQLYFVRENLRLRVMDARLALMQRSGEVYVSDLNSAEAAVKQYFDVQSAATQAWLKELAQLKGLEVQNAQDGNVLASSIAAVRQYQQQAGTEVLMLPELGASAPAASAPASPAAASAPQQEGRAL